MSIRSNLLILFSVTLTVLSVIGLYAVSVYRETLDTERKITVCTSRAVELTRDRIPFPLPVECLEKRPATR